MTQKEKQNTKSHTIKKVVFPVGGLGTRFLPATKSMPKEMLPIAGKPLIQYAFEEAKDAGIEQFIFITGRHKNLIHDHFDHAFELETMLVDKAKNDELSLARDYVPEPGNIIFIRQQNPLGLGHAIWSARHAIGNEPFAVILPDELFLGAVNEQNGLLKNMISMYNQNENLRDSSIIAIHDVTLSEVSKYGIITSDDNFNAKNDFIDINQINAEVCKIKNMVEKPKPEVTPSCTAITGRYILHPKIFEYLEKTISSKTGEIELTDAMRNMILDGYDYYGFKVEGERLDCGNAIGFLEANIRLAMINPLLKEKVKHLLNNINK